MLPTSHHGGITEFRTNQGSNQSRLNSSSNQRSQHNLEPRKNAAKIVGSNFFEDRSIPIHIHSLKPQAIRQSRENYETPKIQKMKQERMENGTIASNYATKSRSLN